ncbi:MAG: flippase [Nanoarchaeota archaeon]|nr:flippase [Nanoarchaeota archaeon]
MDFLHSEERDLRGVIKRFRNRDFKGTGGQVIKNSTYQLATNLSAKVGSVLFTIVIARMLLPELFGLYSLSLSTIVLFSTFSDLGIGSAMVTFISKALSNKDNKKAKSYYFYLSKYKIVLIIFSSILLILCSYFIANFYYEKPIFIALLFGGVYLLVNGMISLISSPFTAINNFKIPFVKELIFQILRISVVPLGIYLIFRGNISQEFSIAIVIFLLTLCYFFSLIYLYFSRKKIYFLKANKKSLNVSEKKSLKKFVLPLSLTVLSGLFFGYIDTLMLGHYVESTYIGYYGAAFGLIGAASTLIGFVSGSVLPVFSRLKNKSLESLFKKILIFTISVSLFAAVFTFFLAKYILYIYGAEYLPAVGLLKLFSILLIIIPLSATFDTYLISRRKTSKMAWFIIISTIVNIVLNYSFITYGLRFGMMQAVTGACIATIISKVLYFSLVGIYRRKISKKYKAPN